MTSSASQSAAYPARAVGAAIGPGFGFLCFGRFTTELAMASDDCNRGAQSQYYYWARLGEGHTEGYLTPGRALSSWAGDERGIRGVNGGQIW
jgi:hypothetical protein